MKKFKKARVIMLPTERGILVKRNTTNELKFSGLNNPLLWIPQSLYIVSNDKIKEGDYYLFFKNNSICKAEFLTEENIEVLEGLRKIKAVQKIIAATDTLLIEDKRTYICGLMDKPNILPYPSQQFIEKYIESYNKSEVITDILVEYEKIVEMRQGYPKPSKANSKTEWNYDKITSYKLKVNPKDNSINICFTN